MSGVAPTAFRLGATATGEPVAERAGVRWTLADLLGDRAPATLLELVADDGGRLDMIEAALLHAPAASPLADGWAVPVRPPKLICIGANYNAHNAEMLGELVQPFPYSFLKPPSTTVVADGTTVAFPGHAEQLDYEAELAVVMGAGGEVFGYTVMNDLSVRDWIPAPTLLGMDWVMLKAFDGSAPLGPTITPARFVADAQVLGVRSWVNGELRQESSTADMTFSVDELVVHLRGLMTLEPGDVIATGTPAGVGAGFKPPRFLRPGDEVVIEVDGLGRLTTAIGSTDN